MKEYNKLAISYIEKYAGNRAAQAKESIDHVCEMSNISKTDLYFLTSEIKEKARIGVHFHPYRLNDYDQSVIELLLECGIYKNQFETKISNGSLTAYIGGKRDVWENVLFDQIYADNNIKFSNRPKYGALHLLGHSDGPSPRFGSCYFLLKPTLTKFATFTYFDSHLNPEEKGTINHFDSILSSALSECFERDYVLGEHNIRPRELVRKIIDHLNADYAQVTPLKPNRNLNHYIEAQIHTEIDLRKDVDYLVADSSYRNSVYHSCFDQLCEKYDLQLLWYPGFELLVEDVPDHFRGAAMPSLAEQIAEDQKINAYLIGKAEKKYKQKITNPEIAKAKFQQLKYLWHTLVKYGRPIEEGK